MAQPALDIVKTTPHCGAEVRGIDLSRSLDEATSGALTRALAEHCVLFFRDQSLTPEQHKALGRRFGELHLHPAFPDILEGHPEIMVIRADENSKRIAGEDWHSDVSCDPEPPLGTILYMQEVPPAGGDTLFASMTAAYDALSPGLQRLLEGLHAVNASAKADVTRTREDRIRTDGRADAKKEYVAEHPVVRTHPETGRKALYVNIAHTVRFAGMTEAESAPLLGYLFELQVRPEFTCRFVWRPGSIAFWDNRCTQHNPINDYHGYRRVMHRITLEGDAPR